jgi:hypothetical protein
LFANDTAFAAHRRDGQCLDPTTLVDKRGNPRLVERPSRTAPDETVWTLAPNPNNPNPWHRA